MSRFALLLVLLFTLSNTGFAHASDEEKVVPSLVAHRATSPIRIDGHLDEADWKSAMIASDFKQYEPVEGGLPSQATEVRVLYASTSLYIGAKLSDTEPEKILRTLGRRDQYNQADWFTVAIDSYFDRKTAYTFAVNAAGIQLDGITANGLDESWDAVWDSAVKVTDEGWFVEMRIPYAMLRFAEADVQTWGINFRRYIPRNSELDEWALIPRNERRAGQVARFGRLQGLQNLHPRRNIQVTPYTVSSVRTEEGDPGRLHSSNEVDLGGDIKIGISSNITLDATFNPDFGQVEADPAELNLSAFETFFPERRPFFTEGVQIFNFGLSREGSLLYTRRIGGSNPIIGASKLSGRTEKGLSFGLLGAATGTDFSPTRYYGIARVIQEIGPYSTVGAMLTGFDRHNEGSTSDRSSVTGGLDWDFRFQNNTYQLDGFAVFSNRANAGESSSETGMALGLGFDKNRGDWTFGSGVTAFDDRFNINDLGRMRRNNTLRFSGSLGHQINGGQPIGAFRRASARTFFWQNFTYVEGIDQGGGLWASTDLMTNGFQEIEVNFFTDYVFGGVDVFETRGNGHWAPPREYSIRSSFSTDSRRTWQLEPGGRATFAEGDGQSYSINLEGSWNAGSRLSLSADVEYDMNVNRTAWASNETFAQIDGAWVIGRESVSPDVFVLDDIHPLQGTTELTNRLAALTPDAATGYYYAPIFGKRDTRSIDFSLRSNVTFSPALSLQLYGQVFVAKGQFDDYQLLQSEEVLASLSSYPKRHDFSLNSFQTNVVLRWEYRPGSTLFLVWSQSRRSNHSLDPFDVTSRSLFERGTFSQIGDTFDLFPTNVFLLKLNYKFMS